VVIERINDISMDGKRMVKGKDGNILTQKHVIGTIKYVPSKTYLVLTEVGI
jgi:hypothetical protein